MAFIYKKGKYWNVTSEPRRDIINGVRVQCCDSVIATARDIRVAWKSFTIKMRHKGWS
jgi:hypothetical protein